MPRFRWDLKNDIALASEVATHRPLKPAGWDEIASTLNTSFSTDDNPVGLKGRGCKDRLDLLLKKYKDEDTKALKRSGTEEEYAELRQFLEDILVYQRDFAAIKAEKHRSAVQTRNADEQKRGETHKAAMEGNPARLSSSSSTIDLDEDNLDDENDDVLSAKKMKLSKGKGVKRYSKSSAVEVLKVKFERKVELKEKELEVKRMELELQRHKMDLEEEERKRRWEVEQEERKKRLEMEMEERRAYIALLTKHMNSN